MHDSTKRSLVFVFVFGLIIGSFVIVGVLCWFTDQRHQSQQESFNRFVEGSWTCQESNPNTVEMTVDGNKLSGSHGDKAISGGFTSPTTLEFTVNQKDGSSNTEIRCLKVSNTPPK